MDIGFSTQHKRKVAMKKKLPLSVKSTFHPPKLDPHNAEAFQKPQHFFFFHGIFHTIRRGSFGRGSSHIGHPASKNWVSSLVATFLSTPHFFLNFFFCFYVGCRRRLQIRYVTTEDDVGSWGLLHILITMHVVPRRRAMACFDGM